MTNWVDENEFPFMRTCRDNYRKLGDCIHAVIGANKAFDIGCGVGDCTARLAELGWDIVGGEHSAVARSMAKGATIVPFDLTNLETEPPEVDTIICTETAEHLYEEHEANIVRVVASAGKRVVFSAAQPGQEWPGHVNLKPIQHWLTRFRMHGWRLAEAQTSYLRILMVEREAQHYRAASNFCVLERT